MTALVLLAGGLAYALPVGNPSEASLLTQGVFFGRSQCNPCDPCFYWFDAWSMKVGYYGDFVFNRHLEIDGKGTNMGKTIETTKISTNAGYLALNICDKLDIFGTLGASRMEIVTSNESWKFADGTQGRLQWDTTFSWSAGARATLLTQGNFALGVEGQYFQTDPDLSSYVNYADGVYTYLNENNKMRYREWQVGMGLSYSINCYGPAVTIVPYADVKWAWSRFQTYNFHFVRNVIGDSITIFNLKAQKLWGYAVGLTAVFYNQVGVTVEGRWCDEKAISVNGQFRF